MTYIQPTGFSFAIYRIPMHSGQYLQYHFAHPVKEEQSVLFSLFLRAYRIYDGSSLQVQISYMSKSIQGLGYQRPVIEIVHAKIRSKCYSTLHHTEPRSQKPTVRLTHNQFTENYMASTLFSQNLRVANTFYASIGSKNVKKDLARR